ncbi:MAG: SpoIID/LytB domain-containing protein [Firmicutes bacterium]|nr:SpoIID/LytB domain-containing protein [Bacillota bacterium]
MIYKPRMIIFMAFVTITWFSLFQFHSGVLADTDSFQRAILEYYQGGFGPSLKTIRDIFASSPDNPLARRNLISLLRESGNYTEAIKLLKESAPQSPPDPRWRLDLMQMTYLAGQWEETLKLADFSLTGAQNLNAGELYWQGLAWWDLGREAEAAQAFIASLALEPFNPMANYLLGQFYQKKADYEKAVAYYKKAAAQEPNLTKVYYPLAQIYLAQQKYQSAYSLLLNAQASYPWDQEIAAALKKFQIEHPEVIRQLQEDAQKRRQIVNPPQITPVIDGREKIPEIRIGLAEKIERFYIKAGGGRFRLSDLSGSKSFQGNGPMNLLVKRNGPKIEVRNEQGSLLFTGDGTASLTYDDPAATTILFDVEYGQGTFWAGREDRSYRGDFLFLPKESGITIVNRVNLEEYLYGVVPAEMSPSWPQAALEAQAVAARTYALANLKSYEARGFDLLATVASQVYSGVGIERKTTNQAVDATRGQVLRYNGKLISAFYTGNNGGYSNDSRDIWGFSLPYLQAVPDKNLSRSGPFSPADLAEWLASRPLTYSSNPQYSGRSQYRWVLWVSRTDLENRLKLGGKLGRITAVAVTGRGQSGVVTKVNIYGTAGNYTVTGDSIRSKLGGLRSNLFIVEPKFGKDGLPDCFIFYGGGWGHGVGMCQSGAAGMAADGYKCPEILAHYYPGTELYRMY